MQYLGQLHQRLQTALMHTLQSQQWQCQSVQQRLRAAQPNFLQLDKHLSELGRRLKDAMQRVLERGDNRLLAAQQHMLHLDPQQVLARGYSLVRDESGAVVRDSETLPLGASLQITFAHGWARVDVSEKGGS
jgi:exodeoxyribonuclease VII large subunit